ncbi:MAG: hypothetical protein HOI95_18980 [Chromatiales bacterium]|jgi:hypothetical protein|nr:hypothetical protein [Chromatiales bacterium]
MMPILDALDRNLDDSLAPPSQHNPLIPVALDYAILTAMARKADGRPQDVEAFRALLGASAPPPGWVASVPGMNQLVEPQPTVSGLVVEELDNPNTALTEDATVTRTGNTSSTGPQEPATALYEPPRVDRRRPWRPSQKPSVNHLSHRGFGWSLVRWQ